MYRYNAIDNAGKWNSAVWKKKTKAHPGFSTVGNVRIYPVISPSLMELIENDLVESETAI